MAHVQNLCGLSPFPVRPERSASEVEGWTALRTDFIHEPR